MSKSLLIKNRILNKSNNLVLIFLFVLGLFLPTEKQEVVNCSDPGVSACVLAGGVILLTKLVLTLFYYFIDETIYFTIQSQVFSFAIGALLLSVPSTLINILTNVNPDTCIKIAGDNPVFLNKLGQLLLFVVTIVLIGFFLPLVQVYPMLAIAGALCFFFISSVETWYMANKSNDGDSSLSEEMCCNSFVNESKKCNVTKYWQNSLINLFAVVSMYLFYFKYNKYSTF